MKRKPTSILLRGLTLLISGLNLCGQALAQEVGKDSSRIPLTISADGTSHYHAPYKNSGTLPSE
jgi:hypothetical protein